MRKLAINILAVGALMSAPAAMAAAKKPAAKPAAKAAAKGKAAAKPAAKGKAGKAAAPKNRSWEDASAITGKLGTLGFGLELSKPINNNWNARFGLNYWSRSDDRTESGVRYDGDLKLNTYAFLADYHGKSGWRATGGFMINANKLDLNSRATGAGTVNINGFNYTAAAGGATVGTLNGKVDFNTISPYLGIGYGDPFMGNNKAWSFSLDLGLLFQGSPDVSLATSNLASAAAGSNLATDVRAEERQLENAIDNFDIYPVISVGGAYRF